MAKWPAVSRVVLVLLCWELGASTRLTKREVLHYKYPDEVGSDETRELTMVTSPDIVGSVKYKTLHDYDTKMIAYKDSENSQCYLERMKSSESGLRQKLRRIQSQSQSLKMREESRTMYVSENYLSKYEVWRLAGPRISAFCRGFFTTLLQELRPQLPSGITDNALPDQQTLWLSNLQYGDAYSQRVNGRSKRQTTYTTRGYGRRHRGQTQAQYLAFQNGGNAGKAEAESSPDLSRTHVSGTNGMGQAQSQTAEGDGCEGCFPGGIGPFGTAVGVPGVGIPDMRAPGLLGIGSLGVGIPGEGAPGIGLPGVGLPGVGELGVTGVGTPGVGVPGVGVPGARAPRPPITGIYQQPIGVPGVGIPEVPGVGVPGGVPGVGVPGGVPGVGVPGGVPGVAPGVGIPGGIPGVGVPGGVPGISVPGVAPGVGIPGGIPGVGVPWVPGVGVPGTIRGVGVPGGVPGVSVPGTIRGVGVPGGVPGIGVPGVVHWVGVPGGIPGTGVPGEVPGAGIPAAVPSVGVPGVVPGIGVPASVPGTGVPWGIPGVGVPGAVPGIGVPASVPGTGIPWGIPGVGVPGVVPGIGAPAAVPGTGVPLGVPGTGLPGRIPGAGVPTGVIGVQVPGGVPSAGIPGVGVPGIPTVGVPGGVPSVGVPGVPSVGVPGGIPSVGVPSTGVLGIAPSGAIPYQPGIYQQPGIGTQVGYPGGGVVTQPQYVQPGVYTGQEVYYTATGDSQAESTITQADKETRAVASAQGKYRGGTAQTQVSGIYSGTGAFSAQAQTSDRDRGAQSQVVGGKEGATSTAQGQAGSGKTQSQVQLGSSSGATTAEAQSGGLYYGTNTQVQAGHQGGMADAQAKGQGSTSSQAQIGFTPYQKNDRKNGQNSPFRGGGSASAQSGAYSGQSQSQIQGSFLHGISYTGAAQAGSGQTNHSRTGNSNYENFGGKLGLVQSGSRDSISQNGAHTSQAQQSGYQTFGSLNGNPSSSHTSTRQQIHEEAAALSHSNDQRRYDDETIRQPHAFTGTETETGSQHGESSNLGVIRNGNGRVQGGYRIQTNGNGRNDTGHIGRPTQTQHIVLGPLNSHGAHIVQDSDDQDQYSPGDILQPGQTIHGTPEYTIPKGYRGRITSVAGPQKTSSQGGQSQTVVITPGAGNVTYNDLSAGRYQPPVMTIPVGQQAVEGGYEQNSQSSRVDSEKIQLRNGGQPSFPVRRNGNQFNQRNGRISRNGNHIRNGHSLNTHHQSTPDSFVTVTKSVTGQLDNGRANNSTGKYTHTYYTKSSTCGYFTFSCNIVFGSNGRTKICRPNPQTKPDGTPCCC